MSSLDQKIENLHRYCREAGSALLAFSGGVDSTLLAAVARKELGKQLHAVTMDLPVMPRREISEVRELAGQLDLNFTLIPMNGLLQTRPFREHPPERCYLCKTQLFSGLLEIAAACGARYVFDGSNADDNPGDRPGMKALQELGIRSPLRECGFSKEEIRTYSRMLKLPTAEKPPSPCMASRIPFGTPVTPDKLRKIEAAEDFLHDLGIRELRVRLIGNAATIQTNEKIPLTADQLIERFREFGFDNIKIDPAGLRKNYFTDRAQSLKPKDQSL